MIFREDLAEKVLRGEKTVTRRLCSDNPRSPWWREQTIYTAGKRFAVQCGRGKPSIGFARVVRSGREPIGVLTKDEACREGFAHSDGFAQAWSEMHGDSLGDYDAAAWVWRIEFEVIPAIDHKGAG
jgi:hypothetical protein